MSRRKTAVIGKHHLANKKDERPYEVTPLPHGLVNRGIAEDHYIFGGRSGIVDRPVILPSGDWGPFLPVPEYQNNKVAGMYDSQNCTVYGTHNALETLAKFLGFNDFPSDCSERYGGVVADTGPNGNDPHHVIETIRTAYGVIPESALPFTPGINSYEKYFYPKPMTADFIRLGESIIKKFAIAHEWIFNTSDPAGKQDLLKVALMRGTVAVSVQAWSKDKRSGLYRKPVKGKDNHWVQLVSFQEGKSWCIFDHYDKVFKYLEWEYNFNCAKIYYLSRRTESPGIPGNQNARLVLLAQLVAAATALVGILTAAKYSGVWNG